MTEELFSKSVETHKLITSPSGKQLDFNAGTTNTFGGLLEDFCMENDFIISDYAIVPQDTFTYISDAHNTTSWIDRFVSSFSVHQAMLNMDVLTECIISDHQLWQSAFSAPTFLNLMTR